MTSQYDIPGNLNRTSKPHLLITAHYWTPDEASTGQLLAELAEGLLEQFEVTAICVVPSYTGKVPDKYKTRKYYFKSLNGVNIIRIRVPEFSKSNKISRVKNIMAYFFGAMGVMEKLKHSQSINQIDYILSVSQPPILGGLLGVWGKWILKNRDGKHVKLIYQIQDFNPEQTMAVGYIKSKLLIKFMMWFDKFSCCYADLVITVGRDLVETMKKRFKTDTSKTPKIELINNWVNEKKIYPLPPDNPNVSAFKKKYGLDDKFVIMYSGNIGLYYDLENLMKALLKIKPGTTTPDGRDVIFAFVGAGTVLDKLVKYQKDNNMDNVVFIPYQAKADLIYSLNAADIHWCMSAKGIKGVSCPSKFYGLIAVGKPVLGVLERGTEVRFLIEKIHCGLVSEPGDYLKVEENIRWFIENAGSSEINAMGRRGYEYLHDNLTREMSIDKYKKAILSL